MYAEQLDRMERLAKAVLYIVEQLETHPVDHPTAMRAYNAVLFGIIPRISAECSHCGKEVIVQSVMPVGGMDDALAIIQEAIEVLEMEVNFSGEGEEQVQETDN